MKYKIFKRDSIPIIVIFFFVLITILCFILDYFDLPTKIGINVNLINMDFWGIFIGNGIVVVLFIITFMLFDKRNLDKEKLANYTGAILLQNTYKQCETFLPILERFLKSNECNKKSFSVNTYDFIASEPFKNNDKILEFLGKGYITRKHYESYTSIKQSYENLVYHIIVLREFPAIEGKIYDILVEDLYKEIKTIERYIDFLN